MKSNTKFFTIIASMILVASMLLVGCISIFAEDNGAEKPYMSNAIGDKAITSIPSSQSKLKEKFDSMSNKSEDKSEIELITQEYISGFWKTIGEKNKPVSLTKDEVLYIVQDSVNLYYNGGYEKIILPAYSAGEAKNGIIPNVSEKVYTVSGKQPRTDIENIHGIISHRLRLLSSPSAFVKFCKEDSYYIPEISSNTDLRTSLENGAQLASADSSSTYFIISNVGEVYTGEIALVNGEKKTAVFPSEEMLRPYKSFLFGKDGEAGPYIYIDLVSGYARTNAMYAMSTALFADIERKDNELILTFNGYRDGETPVYVFKKEGNSFISTSDGPYKWLNKGATFSTDETAFWDYLSKYIPPERNDPSDNKVIAPGEYELNEYGCLTVYEDLILGDHDWSSGVPNIKISWKLNVKVLYHEDKNGHKSYTVGVSENGTFIDYTSSRSRVLDKEEFEQVMRVLKFAYIK